MHASAIISLQDEIEKQKTKTKSATGVSSRSAHDWYERHRK